ncbi:monocarboxylate transporter 9-like isoform X2 [Anoplophora glabripennis]|uniref:monocarboxylate transporter 9-like isoform X2 n=1 Tax=Anoplophora glabripennis TaxID=217634 RepID=UPI00087502D1|nr:monocarboxylate transporter 9-like isoform X2 [Anoplophora glabripennis]
METTGTPPDGGWGWMVVLGAALINMVNQALFANFGLIFGEELEAMADGKATGIMLVMSGSVLVTNFSGLLVGPLMRKFSVRTITIFGILCVGTGMICCSFSTEIWQIILGYSCVTGLGLGLLASVTFLAINSYFTTKKSTAVGLAMAGTSVGQMVFPTFIGILLKKYYFSGATMILGAISYTGILGALLFKPMCACCKRMKKSGTVVVENGTKSDYDVNFNDDIKENGKDSEKRLMEDHNLLEQKPLTKKGSAAIISNGLQANYRDSAIAMANSTEFANAKEEPGTTCCGKFVKSLGLNLLKDLSFVHIVIGLSFGYLSTVTFSTFFPLFLQDEIKFSIMEASTCMTALSFSDVLGRITVSELCRKLHLSNKSSFMLGCILLAVTRSCMKKHGGNDRI